MSDADDAEGIQRIDKEAWHPYLLHGQEVQMYWTGALAWMMDLRTPVLNSWVREGIMPQSPFRMANPPELRTLNRPIHTREQVLGVRRIIREIREEFPDTDIKETPFTERVMAFYEELIEAANNRP